MKKFFTYPVFVVLFLSFIGAIGFGGLLKYHYEGGERFQFLQNVAVTIAEVPYKIRFVIKNKTINFNKLPYLDKNKDKERFKQFIGNERNALLVLPRYEHSLGRSVVDIIDLNDFEVIHTYKHDIREMNSKVKNIDKFPRINVDHSPRRFRYDHPIVLDDGSLISFSKNQPIFKIDFCSKLKWINDEEMFHHGQNLDRNEDIWVIARIDPQSRYVSRYYYDEYWDDAIVKIDVNGNILYKKSVTEILIENDVVLETFVFNNYISKQNDPIHLNDIEPAFQNTEYWKKDDLFLSIRDQNAIVHYRPSTNKVLNVITGPFIGQHDVDIISDKEISIFNNNQFIKDNKYSEVLVYNFETKTFKKIFNDQLQKNNFKTETNGLSEIFRDGALMVEETIHGRIILFNNQGQKEWEYVNKDKNGNIGRLFWSRIIEDELFIKNFKSMVKNETCLN
tara:strand:- start:263 stop:1609 length:1347 start_codon:yes stop_codon:yes gene_type:complete